MRAFIGYCVLVFHLCNAAEYCLKDTFSPKCSPGEVIVLTHARFGRMNTGKCVAERFGYQGCYDDVLPILDEACSGKKECHYPIFESELEDSQACPKELKSFLEAEYMCQPVIYKTAKDCKLSRKQDKSLQKGYLSSHMIKSGQCGSENRPWVFEVSPGQRVNISMTDFNQKKNYQNRKGCRTLGYIHEDGHRNNVSICNTQSRNEQIYASNGGNLRMGIRQDRQGEFLLKFEVYGCSDIDLPANAWYKRHGDTATTGCEGKATIWNIECIGSEWVGFVGNCTDDLDPMTAQVSSRWLEKKPDFTTMVLIMIAGGFVVLIIICVTLIIIKFRKSDPIPPHSNMLISKDPSKSADYNDTMESSHYKSLKSRGSNPSRPVSYTVPRHVQDQEAFNTQFRPSSHVFSSTLPRNTPALPFPPDTKYEDESDASPGEGQGNYNAPNYFILDQNYVSGNFAQ